MHRKALPPVKCSDSEPIDEFKQCQICSVRHTSVCAALSNEEHSRLNDIAYHRHFGAGQIMMSDQDASFFLATLRSGVVKLTRETANRARDIVGLLFPPDFLGHAFTRKNPYFAEAVSDVDICCFPRRAFEGVAKEYPNLEHRLFYHTVREINAERDWTYVLSRKTAEQKVASFLLLLARRVRIIGCADVTVEIDLPLSEVELADTLGLTVDTVCSLFSSLEERGHIELSKNRQAVVTDYSALASLADY